MKKFGVAVSLDGKDWQFLPEVWEEETEATASAEHWLEQHTTDLAEVQIFVTNAV